MPTKLCVLLPCWDSPVKPPELGSPALAPLGQTGVQRVEQLIGV